MLSFSNRPVLDKELLILCHPMLLKAIMGTSSLPSRRYPTELTQLGALSVSHCSSISGARGLQLAHEEECLDNLPWVQEAWIR